MITGQRCLWNLPTGVGFALRFVGIDTNTSFARMCWQCQVDPAIDPSRRPPGSICSPGGPIVGNYGPGGLARVMTRHAWLSTWSGLSGQADLPDTIARVTIPTLIVYADGDRDIFPSEQLELFEQSGAADKTAMELAWADHYLHAAGDEGARLAGPHDGVIDMIAPWIEAHIGAP